MQIGVVRPSRISSSFASLLHALSLKAGQALLLAEEATACVAAWKLLVAGLSPLFLALCLETNVIKCTRIFIFLLVRENVTAKAALLAV